MTEAVGYAILILAAALYGWHRSQRKEWTDG